MKGEFLIMKDFGIYAVESELKKTEQLAKESEMEYKKTVKFTSLDRLIYGISPLAPEMYCVVVSGTDEQFTKFVSMQKGEMIRFF